MFYDDQSCDVVIPLGSGSKLDNLELRLALRSIAAYAANCRNIYLIGETIPDWVNNLRVLHIPDKHKHNKDANIIDKLLAVAELDELSERFIFWSDDQLALQKFSLTALLPAYNRRSRRHFIRDQTWHRRMRHTFDLLAEKNIFIQWNWDSHLPQPLNKTLFRQLVGSTDYAVEPGYCVNTLYFALANTLPRLEQSVIKATFEQAVMLEKLPEKLFCGYNDNGLQGNLLQLLQEHFPQPCIYEKPPEIYYPA